MEKIVLATTSKEISAREIAHDEIAKRIAQEGIVLLKNDGMLPLKEKKIALYGSGARQTIAGGTGSGAMHPRKTVGIEEGLKAGGFEILSERWLDNYDNSYDLKYKTWKDSIESRVKDEMDLFKILGVIARDRFVYPTGIKVEEEDLYDADVDCIYVIARQAGEGADRKDIKADYRLDDIEYENLKIVTSHYKKVCVVINVGGFIDLSFVDELNVNSVIYYSQAGQAGGYAFSDIVSGKVSPSGKLTATWPVELKDVPSTETFSINGDAKEQDYKEGIYVGYRYFDTFNVKPRYAFGYGLTYSKFDMSLKTYSLKNETLSIEVNVKNVGGYKAKEVIEVYASTPNPDSEYKRLVAFVKTDALDINESKTYSLSFTLKDLAYYDSEISSYVLAKGNYVVRIGSSSDDTKDVLALSLDKCAVIERCKRIGDDENLKFTDLKAKKKEFDIKGLPVIEIDRNEINVKTNKYDSYEDFSEVSDFVKELSNEELVHLVVGGGTGPGSSERLVNTMGASGSTSSALYEKYGIPNIILSDGPQGLNLTPRVVDCGNGVLKSADTYPQYDFGMFGKVMMRRMIASETDGVCHYQYATAFPAGVVRAQTWNTALMEEFGDSIGKEMEELGVTCWLAPGININRNTLCGRTFEYCSEDPVLSGEIAASTIIGVERHEGKGTSIKHFACNNSEFEREYSSSNVSERAMREIYLKGFEIAIKKSNPMTVMASYNMLNHVYNTNNDDILNSVLRSEWGYKGSVISDWDSVRNDRGNILIAYKNGLDLVMPGNSKQEEEVRNALDNKEIERKYLERAASRILTIVKKNTIVKVK